MDNRTLEEVRNNETKLIKEIKQLEDKVKQAVDIAFEYAQIDGAHHKMWVIDQMVRILLGDDYKKKIEKYMFDGKTQQKQFKMRVILIGMLVLSHKEFKYGRNC